LALFRADASPEIGIGHVQRCLSVGRVLSARGWTAAFASTEPTKPAVPALENSGFAVLTVGGGQEAEIEAMRRHWPRGAEVLVVDHYGRDAGFERAVRGFARRIVAIDDLPSRPHDADLLVDPTAGRNAQEYRDLLPPGARIRAGADFIMLRPEVVGEPRPHRTIPPPGRRLVIAFGGSDPDGLTMRAVEALRDARLAEIEAVVIVGAANPHAAAIAAGAPPHVRVLANPPDLPALMANADIALAGSGTMAWEFAYFGVPSILVVHSRGTVVPALTGAGAARSLGSVSEATPAAMADAIALLAGDAGARAAMSVAGRAVVDGRGAGRVADAIEELAGE
jgi:UDP-2,4-diacetamido-2,4,6-trideoxy-beta-L-altropyranose hydrolase